MQQTLLKAQKFLNCNQQAIQAELGQKLCGREFARNNRVYGVPLVLVLDNAPAYKLCGE
ncbi:MAG: hypothetical protein MHMPM18_001780 [Marteilia pararefringens]